MGRAVHRGAGPRGYLRPGRQKARQINGLINEWYLEDLSGNVRAVLDHKRRCGSYIASFALYGYRKDPKDHSRLLPDEPAAQVVRQIFALYLQGNGAGRIAQTLNAQGVPPPSAYRAVSAGQPRPTPAPLWCKGNGAAHSVHADLRGRSGAGPRAQAELQVPQSHPPAAGGLDHRTRHPRAAHQPGGFCSGAGAAGGAWRTDSGSAPPAGWACPVWCLRRQDGADRRGGAAVLPLPHGVPEQDRLPRPALLAAVRRRGACRKQLSRYAAAPGQLTQDQAAALLQKALPFTRRRTAHAV